MKRKIIAGLLSLCIALSACGCDNESMSAPVTGDISKVETSQTEKTHSEEPQFTMDRSTKIDMDIKGIDTSVDIYSVPNEYINNTAVATYYLGDSDKYSVNKWIEKNFSAIISRYLEKGEAELITDADIQSEVNSLYQRHIALNDYFRYIEVTNPDKGEIKPEVYYRATNTVSVAGNLKDLYYRYEKVYYDVNSYNQFCKDFLPVSISDGHLYLLGSTIVTEGNRNYFALNTFAGNSVPMDSVYGKTENYRLAGGISAVAVQKGDNICMAFIQTEGSCVRLYTVLLKKNMFGQLRIYRNMNARRAFSGSYGTENPVEFNISGGDTEINNAAGHYSDDEVTELTKPEADYALLEYELRTTGSHEFVKWVTANTTALLNRALAANPEYTVVGDFEVQNSIKQLFTNHVSINSYFSHAAADIGEMTEPEADKYYKLKGGISGVGDMQQLYELEQATYSDITTYENFTNKFSPIKIENGEVYALGSVLRGEGNDKYLSVNSFLNNRSAFDLTNKETFVSTGRDSEKQMCFAVRKNDDVYIMFITTGQRPYIEGADSITLTVKVCVAKTEQNELGEYRIYRNTDWNSVF